MKDYDKIKQKLIKELQKYPFNEKTINKMIILFKKEMDDLCIDIDYIDDMKLGFWQNTHDKDEFQVGFVLGNEYEYAIGFDNHGELCEYGLWYESVNID